MFMATFTSSGRKVPVTKRRCNRFTLTIAVLAILVLSGCSNWKSDYVKEATAITPTAKALCEGYGQSFVHAYFNGATWEAVCLQTSPTKIIYKDVIVGFPNE